MSRNSESQGHPASSVRCAASCVFGDSIKIAGTWLGYSTTPSTSAPQPFYLSGQVNLDVRIAATRVSHSNRSKLRLRRSSQSRKVEGLSEAFQQICSAGKVS
ncbi:hypothetical protein TNCV_1675181 [Trichonephila clavipes]|nr:hypothetical protein TNCV_1675181 [Trichonephila clavipes]